MKTWSDEEARYECPHCNALYQVTITRFPCKDSDSVTCDVCKRQISWNDTMSPSNFRLITGAMHDGAAVKPLIGGKYDEGLFQHF